MEDFKGKLENIKGIIGILDDACDSVTDGTEIIEGVKKGSIITNFKQVGEIRDATYRMKKKFYLLWTALIIVTVILCFFI